MSSAGHNGFGINLAGQPWNQLAPGLREKSQAIDQRRFRLVEFSEAFRELDWCFQGHVGYVVAGEIVVNVDGELVTYREGDVIDLPAGTRHRHDRTITTAVLILIEHRTDKSSSP